MWYRTGTLTLTNGSATVIGVGTNWIDVQPGWILKVGQGASLSVYEIKNVVSSTQIELTEAHGGDTVAAQTYSIIQTYGLAKELREAVTELLEHLQSPAAFLDYATWLEQPGNAGKTFAEYQAEFVGPAGQNAYQVWLDAGNTGTEADFFDDISAGAVAATASNVAAAETAKDAAVDASALALQWANEVEDTEVTPGLYSSLHHAAKAAASQAQLAADLVTAQGVLSSVQTIFDNFDDRYLGSFTTANEPALDNDGDPLQIGAMYLNEDEQELRFWTGSAWSSPEATAEAAAAQTLQLKTDVEALKTSVETSETNASNHAIKAGQWAEAAEDTEVEPGKHSALHHAAKAEQHASAASVASNASAWVQGPWTEGQLVWSPLDHATYRAKTTHDDVATDPSVDTTNWAPATGAAHNHEIAEVTGLQVALDGKATSAQGAKADTAVQPGALHAVATSGDYNDLTNKPTLINPIAASIIFGG